ncbi:MAG: F0F1 ATP synthase subunit A [Patescibacteria group bacterium]|nr:F0F1 ATP synthase subunit A [Patescibacteria group bacterium]MDE2437916.1 F0F1 ATP synthase subunit A [Patescibacteria group bacterium]
MPHIEIAAEHIIGFVTNTLLSAWVVLLVWAGIAFFLSKGKELVPSMLQNVVEIVLEALLGLLEDVFGSRRDAERYLPLIGTIFLFILTSNWLGIVPGFGSVGFFAVHEGQQTFVPFLRSGASDLNTTLALAIVAMVLVQIFGIMTIGFVRHVSKFFTLKTPIDFFVGILEFISELAKIISFSFRLFGNIFAGEVLLIVMGALAPYLVPVPFLGLELFVGFIQALVFAMLTMVFIEIATTEHY